MIIATIQKIENIQKFKEAGADALIIPAGSLNETQAWIEAVHEAGLLAYLDCSLLYMEEELPQLEQLLTGPAQQADGIYYSGEGLYYLAAQAGLTGRLIYQPETLVTNHLDAQYYLRQGIQAVSLAHELSLAEILSIAAHTENLEVLIDGYYPILRSKRKLLRNYFQAIGCPEKNKQVYEIQEMTRQDRMPVLENEHGTTVYSEKPIASFAQMKAFEEAGISRFRLDSIFKDDDYLLERLACYQLAAQGKEVPADDHSDLWYRQQSIRKKEEDKHGKN